MSVRLIRKSTSNKVLTINWCLPQIYCIFFFLYVFRLLCVSRRVAIHKMPSSFYCWLWFAFNCIQCRWYTKPIVWRFYWLQTISPFILFLCLFGPNILSANRYILNVLIILLDFHYVGPLKFFGIYVCMRHSDKINRKYELLASNA